MRILQLLAIAGVCLLAAHLASGCDPIAQPLGEYSAQGSVKPQTRAATGAPTSDGGGSPGGSVGTGADTSATDIPDASLPSFGAYDGAIGLPGAVWPDDGGGVGIPMTDASGCTPSVAFPAERKRLDMYIVMDANVTLPYTGLWEFATDGLRQFVRDRSSQGIGVGIRYFGIECDPDAYDKADVEVGLLPDNADAIAKSTSMNLNRNASPMTPALEGGIQHQSKRALAHPEWKEVVVLVTDGFTQDVTCFSTQQDAENAAADGFNHSPFIETHVIGFGVPSSGSTIADDILQRFGALDSIAAAGGTGSPITVPFGQKSGDMKAAFEEVRRKAQPCEYVMPNDIDPGLLKLWLTPGGELPRVDDAASCGQLPGWYYDDPQDASNLVLCPLSCRNMRASDAQTAIVLEGCPPLRR